jgi:outer membrane protein assembly factor BamE (lipoprotein component of BamABCDE complex)
MKIPLILLTCLFLAGCVTSGRELDPNAVAQIQKGRTNRSQVLQLLGQPQSISTDGNGTEVFVYMFVHAAATPVTYVPIAGAFVGGANSRSQLVTVVFAQGGIVKEVRTTYGANTVGRG